MNTTPNRQPAGTPVGGQFAAGNTSESTTALAADPLTAEQRELVEAIYAAEYADPEDTAERIENMDALYGIDAYDDAAWVAGQLQQGHAPDLAFDYDYATGSMEITGYNVGVRFDDGTQWTAYRDTDELTTDRNATGEAAAAGYAESIMGDYQYMRAKAVKAGLISDSWNHPGPDVQLHTRIDSALRELDPDEGNWPTGEQIDAIVSATQRHDQGPDGRLTDTADMNETWESASVDELTVGDRFAHDGELHRVASTDGDHKSISVETDEGEFLTFRRDQKVMIESAHRCQSCGRPEDMCSADPCGDVIADREAM